MNDADLLKPAATLEAEPDRLDTFAIAADIERDYELRDLHGMRADLHLQALDRFFETIAPHRPNWQTATDDLAKELREIERVRRVASERVGSRSQVPASLELLIDVTELATQINRSVGTTRRLLDAGQIPGAERKTPGVKNSPWLIPATSPARFLEGRS